MTTATIPEPLSAIKDFLSSPQKLLIDGKRVNSSSGDTFEVLDPSNNKVLTRAPKGEKEDIDRAVKSARNAFENGPWSKITVSERGKLIWKLADLIEARTEEYRTRFANPFVAGNRGFIDDVIMPHNTRNRICRSLRMLENKELENPWKKHGNMPL